MSTLQLTKICSKCEKEKQISEFHKSKRGKYGVRSDCKLCNNKRASIYYEKNVDKIKDYRKKYNAENKEYYSKYNKKYYKENIEYFKEYNKKYKTFNKHNRNISRNIRYNEDENYKILCTLRNLTRRAIRAQSGNKVHKTIELLGCTIEECREHLESQFSDGMSWNNHGEWHIDHIRPCASFDLTSLVQQKECFHYTNLQPLWAKDNLSKGAKWSKSNEI